MSTRRLNLQHECHRVGRFENPERELRRDSRYQARGASGDNGPRGCPGVDTIQKPDLLHVPRIVADQQHSPVFRGSLKSGKDLRVFAKRGVQGMPCDLEMEATLELTDFRILPKTNKADLSKPQTDFRIASNARRHL